MTKIPAEFQELYERVRREQESVFLLHGEYEAARKEHDEVEGLLEALDAKNSPGVNVGRVVRIPHADGYAVYLVVKAGTRSCSLLHLPIGDAWRSPLVSETGSCSRKQVETFLRRQDEVRELFADLKESSS